MKKGNVMFWKYLFLGFIVWVFLFRHRKMQMVLANRIIMSSLLSGVAIYLLFKAVGVIWHYRCPKCKNGG